MFRNKIEENLLRYVILHASVLAGGSWTGVVHGEGREGADC